MAADRDHRSAHRARAIPRNSSGRCPGGAPDSLLRPPGPLESDDQPHVVERSRRSPRQTASSSRWQRPEASPPRPDLMDVGSGGGSPGIPLALALGATSLLLVESNQRKAAFLREVLRQLEMRTASVAATRFEELSSSETGPKTLISIRAVKVDGVLFRRFEAFLAPEGRLLCSRAVKRQRFPTSRITRKGVSTIQLIPSRGSILQLFR